MEPECDKLQIYRDMPTVALKFLRGSMEDQLLKGKLKENLFLLKANLEISVLDDEQIKIGLDDECYSYKTIGNQVEVIQVLPNEVVDLVSCCTKKSKSKSASKRRLVSFLGNLSPLKWHDTTKDFKSGHQNITRGRFFSFSPSCISIMSFQPMELAVTGANPSDKDILTLSQMHVVVHSAFHDDCWNRQRVIDRLTNPCFIGKKGNTISRPPEQPFQSSLVNMKRPHNDSDNVETNTNNSQAKRAPAYCRVDKSGYTVGENKRARKGCSLASGQEPPPVISDLRFTNKVTADRFNCLAGNVSNVLDVCGHSSSVEIPHSLNDTQCGDMDAMKETLRSQGYHIFNLPKMMNYEKLEKCVATVKIPMVVNLVLNTDPVDPVNHVIGITPNPKDGATSMIIEGALTSMSPIAFSRENINYVCSPVGFSTTGDGSFAFIPAKKLANKIRSNSSQSNHACLFVECGSVKQIIATISSLKSGNEN